MQTKINVYSIYLTYLLVWMFEKKAITSVKENVENDEPAAIFTTAVNTQLLSKYHWPSPIHSTQLFLETSRKLKLPAF